MAVKVILNLQAPYKPCDQIYFAQPRSDWTHQSRLVVCLQKYRQTGFVSVFSTRSTAYLRMVLGLMLLGRQFLSPYFCVPFQVSCTVDTSFLVLPGARKENRFFQCSESTKKLQVKHLEATDLFEGQFLFWCKTIRRGEKRIATSRSTHNKFRLYILPTSLST